jgi:predicted nucleic-acid-binding protein
MADTAEEIFTTKNVFISNEVLAEVVYVLLGVYKISKQDIASELVKLVNFENISVSNLEIVQQALEIFKEKNIDFVDSLLCAYSREDEIVTFDKKLNECISRENSINPKS